MAVGDGGGWLLVMMGGWLYSIRQADLFCVGVLPGLAGCGGVIYFSHIYFIHRMYIPLLCVWCRMRRPEAVLNSLIRADVSNKHNESNKH